MTDEEKQALMDLPLDATTKVRDAKAMAFIQWCMKKVNGANANSPEVREITMLNGYPGALMTDAQKLEILIKLKRIGLV